MTCGRKQKHQKPTYDSLQSLIVAYIQKYRGQDDITKTSYNNLDEDEALKLAARLSVIRKSGTGWKRHPHFHRPWFYKQNYHQSLTEAADLLIKNKEKLRTAKNEAGFSGVHDKICEILKNIKGLKELAYYDMTTLIGFHWNFEPTKVYLHAGTRKGAEQLFGRSNCNTDSISSPVKLNSQLAILTIQEIEDFLCIYCSEIYNLKSQGRL